MLVFSCCSVKLHVIVDFINSNKRLPENVYSSEQFKMYKNKNNRDVTFDFFEHYEKVIDVNVIDPRVLS